MTDKTLGQVAYEVWWRRKTWEEGTPWSALPQDDKDTWQVAAEAVAIESERRSLVPGVLVQLEGNIVKAAVAAKYDCYYLAHQAEKIGAEYPGIHALVNAVEAYEKEKG